MGQCFRCPGKTLNTSGHIIISTAVRQGDESSHDVVVCSFFLGGGQRVYRAPLNGGTITNSYDNFSSTFVLVLLVWYKTSNSAKKCWSGCANECLRRRVSVLSRPTTRATIEVHARFFSALHQFGNLRLLPKTDLGRKIESATQDEKYHGQGAQQES